MDERLLRSRDHAVNQMEAEPELYVAVSIE